MPDPDAEPPDPADADTPRARLDRAVDALRAAARWEWGFHEDRHGLEDDLYAAWLGLRQLAAALRLEPPPFPSLAGYTYHDIWLHDGWYEFDEWLADARGQLEYRAAPRGLLPRRGRGPGRGP
jgi:hypothetical protein